MNFGFINNLPSWKIGFLSNKRDMVMVPTIITSSKSISMGGGGGGAIGETAKNPVFFDVNVWKWSVLSFIPWAINNARDRFQIPSIVNKKLRQTHKNEIQRGGVVERRRRSGGVSGVSKSGSVVPLFRPYVAKVPWHKGVRAFLSQFFPRYGHYCGPNWSSGKDNGLNLWDQRPIDWLDYCCYCHDIGYDTHDQASLLKADLAFLECLERPGMSTRGDVNVARLYRTMCITGLKNILIPYRKQLVRTQETKSLIEWLSIPRRKNTTCTEA